MNIPARFWYDGQYVNQAKEDAAEVAMERLGQVPSPPTPRPQHQQQVQQYHGAGGISSPGQGATQTPTPQTTPRPSSAQMQQMLREQHAKKQQLMHY